MQRQDKLRFLLRKNSGKHLLEEFISTIKALIVNSYADERRFSLEISEGHLNNLMQKSRVEILNAKFEFNDKSKLTKWLRRYAESWDGVYISIGLSEYCGLYDVGTIDNFEVNFKFFDEQSGLITLYSSNLNRSIAIDSFEEYNTFYTEVSLYEYRS